MNDYNFILKMMTSKKLLPNRVTDSRELHRVGKLLFGNEFLGVFPADQTTNRDGYFIVNTDPKNKPGEHWIAGIKRGSTVYMYDSFGRDSKSLPTLKRWKAKFTDKDVEQSKKETNCGARAMAWLMYAKYFGIKKAMLI